MSSHVSNAFTSEVSAFFRSAGRSWTTPPEISFALRASLISLSPGSHQLAIAVRLSGARTMMPDTLSGIIQLDATRGDLGDMVWRDDA